MNERDEVTRRLDGVERRLAALAAAAVDPGTLTDADPGTGERWELGQIWAHLAEFVPYWIAQAQLVIAAPPSVDPVRFGRTHSDAGRLGAIERDREQPVSVLWSDTHRDLQALRRFLAGTDPDTWRARGQHATRGMMSVPQIVEEFLVGHLEEHADQLESLARGGA